MGFSEKIYGRQINDVYQELLGYKMNNAKLEIVPEEAAIILRIYEDFLSGKSMQNIAHELQEDKIPSPSGKSKWYVSTVESILRNEKYKGDCILQKTYKADVLSNKRIKNKGQEDSYYYTDMHQAIIDRNTADLVLAELKRRKSLRNASTTGHGRYSNKNVFSGIIVCGECHSTYRRHCQWNGNIKTPIWVCLEHQKGRGKRCKAKPVKEEYLKQAFVNFVNSMIGSDDFMEKLQGNITVCVSNKLEFELQILDEQILKLQGELLDVQKTKMYCKGNDKDYDEQLAEIITSIEDLTAKRNETAIQNEGLKLAQFRLDEICKLLGNKEILTEFNETLFRALIEQIVVREDREVEFLLRVEYNAL